MAAPKDIRHADVLGMKITSNDGSRVEDTSLTKPGAKDSLSGTNVTEPFTGSVDIGKMGPFGGMNKTK